MDFKLKGYVCKKSNSPYYYISLSYYVDGVHHRQNVSLPNIKSKNKAKELSYHIVEQKQHELELTMFKKDHHNLKEELDGYVSNVIELSNVRPNTKEKYVQAYNRIINRLGSNIEIESLTQDTYNELLVHLRDNGYKEGSLSYATVDYYNDLLSKFFNYCITKGYISYNFAKYATLPSFAPKIADRKYFNKEEITKILNYLSASPRYKDMYYVTFISLLFGIRRSECLGLHFDQIDPVNKTLKIDRAYIRYNGVMKLTYDLKTPSSYRTFPLTDELLVFFENIKKEHQILGLDDDGFVFINYITGRPWHDNNLSHKFKRAIRELNIPDNLSFKSTRKTTATSLVDMGFTELQIVSYMGWKSIDIGVTHYIQHTQEIKQEGLDRILSFISSSDTK